MKSRYYFASLLFALSLAATPQSAQALTLTEAVERIDAMIAEMTLLKSQLANIDEVSTPAATPQVLGAQASAVLTQDISYGETNDDIAKVQRLLATDSSVYPDGIVSGFFGPKTQNAIRLFQSKFGLDTVGVVGPATKALLERFMAAYPDEEYPVGVLNQEVPQVQSAGTAVAPSATIPPTATSNKYSRILVDEDDDEFIVRSYLANGDRNRDLILYPDDAEELVALIADQLRIFESEVRGLVEIDEDWFISRSSSRNADEEDAEDAMDDADDALDRLRDLIEEADDDGVDVDEAEELYEEGRDLLDEAEEAYDDKDYTESVELAKEAEEAADDAEDELDDAAEESDEIEVIEVTIREDDSRVDVEYADGDDERFTVDETDEDDIIEAIADELDIDEDEVEDVIEFDYGDIERVAITIESDETRVRVFFESGYDLKYVTDEDDEDDIIEEVADEFDLDEDEVERFADVDDRR